MLRLIGEVPALAATVMRPAIKNSTFAPARKAHEPAPPTAEVLRRESERHIFIHLLPVILARAAVAVNQLHAVFMRPETDVPRRLSATIPG